MVRFFLVGDLGEIGNVDLGLMTGFVGVRATEGRLGFEFRRDGFDSNRLGN